MCRRVWKTSWLGGLALLIAAIAQGAEPKLTFDDIKSVDGGATLQADCQAGTPPPGTTFLYVLKDHFKLLHDPSSVGRIPKTTTFRHSFYIEDRSVTPPAWFLCDTQITPLGVFASRYEDANFTISRDGVEDKGRIRIPIVNIQAGDPIEITKPAAPLNVDLSGDRGLEISPHNLSGIPVVIDQAVIVTPTHSKYWDFGDPKKPPRPGQTANVLLPAPKTIDPGQTIRIELPFHPRLGALWGTLTSLKPDGVHDTVGIEVTYKSDVGGVAGPRRVDVDVHFVPSIPSLAFALLAGSLLGTIAVQTLPRAWRGLHAAREIALRGLVLSVATWFLAFFLVRQGSKFVVFNLELDPLQFISVLFIGFVMSGGKAVLRYIKLAKDASSAAEPEGVS